jgi:hypothetical protein
MQRVVGESVRLARDRSEDFLVLALHAQLPVGEASAGKLPAQLPLRLLRFQEQQHFRISAGAGHEGEQGTVHHAGLGRRTAVQRRRQQPQFPALAVSIHLVAGEFLGQPPHLNQPRTAGHGRRGSVREFGADESRLRLPLVERLALDHEFLGIERVEFVVDPPAGQLLVRGGKDAGHGRGAAVPQPQEERPLLRVPGGVQPLEDGLFLQLQGPVGRRLDRQGEAFHLLDIDGQHLLRQAVVGTSGGQHQQQVENTHGRFSISAGTSLLANGDG